MNTHAKIHAKMNPPMVRKYLEKRGLQKTAIIRFQKSLFEIKTCTLYLKRIPHASLSRKEQE